LRFGSGRAPLRRRSSQEMASGSGDAAYPFRFAERKKDHNG
jgi:hypothetical protein